VKKWGLFVELRIASFRILHHFVLLSSPAGRWGVGGEENRAKKVRKKKCQQQLLSELFIFASMQNWPLLLKMMQNWPPFAFQDNFFFFLPFFEQEQKSLIGINGNL